MVSVRRDIPLLLLDLGVVFVAYLVPLVLRFDGRVPHRYWSSFGEFMPMAGLVHIAANTISGLYGQIWRYASVQEARRVVLAGVSAGALILGLMPWTGRHVRPIPLSVAIMGALLSLMAFGAIRFQSRLFAFKRRTALNEPKRVLIVGAGDAGRMVLQDVHRNASLGLEPVGIIDDDPRKVGLSLHGVRVLGTRSEIPPVVARLHVDQVLLAIASATGDLVRDIASLCEEAGVPLRVLPSVGETVNGRVTARDIRDLRIEDLLGRKQVESDLGAVATLLRGKRVLITGAGGSIGSEIARQVAGFFPETLVLLDHDETHLHDLVASMEDVPFIETALADVRDFARLFAVFAKHRPEVVFHAAAHKHVPILEVHPEEALLTNVLGTAIVADAAVATGVSRFVFISTDKAIRPSSVMGSSKWLAEQIVRSLDGSNRTFCAVRFGNVLGSRGSVIPTFLRQIEHGGPVTVTHAEMTRYFMSVHEAVQLVLQAAALAEGGEVFTLDMGEPVNILDLARKVVRLSGRVPGKDIKILVTGPRPGEKLVEDVRDEQEEQLPSGHPSIVVSRPVVPERSVLRRTLRELEVLAAEGPSLHLSERMKSLAVDGFGAVRVELP